MNEIENPAINCHALYCFGDMSSSEEAGSLPLSLKPF